MALRELERLAVVEQKVEDLKESVDKLHGKFDNFLIYAQNLDRSIDKRYEPRLRILEKWQDEFRLTWKVVLAIASGVGVIVTILAQAAVAYFTSMHK